jgi:hypothetical protein
MINTINKYINKYVNQITAISGILIALGIVFIVTGYESYKDLALIGATIIGIIPIAIRAFQALRMKVFSIELLVTIAVVGALYLNEFVESSVVSFLFLFGAYLEARTLEKTSGHGKHTDRDTESCPGHYFSVLSCLTTSVKTFKTYSISSSVVERPTVILMVPAPSFSERPMASKT